VEHRFVPVAELGGDLTLPELPVTDAPGDQDDEQDEEKRSSDGSRSAQG
jgi:hypothetical protein